jgi:uncharacterized protein YkwD
LRLLHALVTAPLLVAPLGACQAATALQVAAPPPAVTVAADPGPALAPSPPAGTAAIEAEIVGMTNAYRSRLGTAPLTTTPALMAFAHSRSQDMATRAYFAHTTPDGLTVFALLRQAAIPFTVARENIGWNKGYADDQVAAEAMDGWIASSGHRTNLEATDVTRLGVGAVQAADGAWYLTQVFTD